MNLIAVQLDSVWENPTQSIARAHRLLTQVQIKPGDLIVLPEMFSTGFSMNTRAIAETPEHHPAEDFLRDLAKHHQSHVLGGLVRRAPSGKGFNQALLIGPDGAEQTRYTKLHPFSFAGETDHYQPGDQLVSFDWAGFTAAPLICYDLRFPEAFRAAVRRGVNLFIVIANWPAARANHWAALLTARAIENQAWVLGVNRSGMDQKLAYPGRSMLIDPRGSIIAEAGEGECILTGKPSLEALLEYRHGFPALADMRNDL